MIRILVDSASDILFTNTEDIIVVPLSVNIGEKNYLDGIDLNHEKFYNYLTQSDVFPKTSQPSPQAFVDEFEKIKDAGDEVICIILSSGISGTFQSANLAKSIVDYDKIHLVDSKSAIFGVKILVDVAKKMIEEGKQAEEIVAHLEDIKSKIQIYCSVDTLEYLARGGRLDKTAAVIGGIAKIKPIIELNREGKINVVAKTIGTLRAMNSIIDIAERKEIDTDYPVYSIYTSGTKNVEKLEKKLADNGIALAGRNQLGPVIGTHVGPEAFGIVFMTK